MQRVLKASHGFFFIHCQRYLFAVWYSFFLFFWGGKYGIFASLKFQSFLQIGGTVDSFFCYFRLAGYDVVLTTYNIVSIEGKPHVNAEKDKPKVSKPCTVHNITV